MSEIDASTTTRPETARPEPVLAAAPFLVEFGDTERPDPARLDPARAIAASEEAPPVSRRAALPLGLLASLAVHLLPLVVLLHWNSAPAESAAPIPVQLVLEEPPPPLSPPLSPEASKPPPPGRLASVDIGDPAAKPGQPAAAAGRASDQSADQPDKTQIAAVLPPPKPMPPPELVSALPKPAPPPEPAAMPEVPQLTAQFKPPVKQAVAARLAPHPAPRAQVLGPAATRDEYLAYCMNLVRRYYDMLPRAFLAGRHGATRLNILVLSNGTIARVAVVQSSGYPEIDRRIEQMVGAVRRFPPLPQWVQGPSITLIYHLAFPDGLQEH